MTTACPDRSTRHRPGSRARALASLAVGLTALASLFVPTARAEVWKVGDFTFSDELGGFRILAAGGSGTVSDPIIIIEEIYSFQPATLVIRNATGTEGANTTQGMSSFLSLAMVKIVINQSERIWGGFDLELQQIYKTPSTYGDGLSFDQTGAFRAEVESDRFRKYRQVEEPLDRIHFYDGGVSPGDQMRLSFFITDPTPSAVFYLVQEPFFLMTERSKDRPQLANKPEPLGDHWPQEPPLGR